MQRSKQYVIFFLAFFWVRLLAASPSPEGYWTMIDDKTGKPRVLVNVIINDGILSGVIEDVYKQPGDKGVCSKCPGEFKDKPTHGLRFVWGLRESSPGLWDGGHILDPKTGKIYRVKMTIKSKKMYVRGYVGFSMLGRTQIWLRGKDVTF